MMPSKGDLVLSDADSDKSSGGLKHALHFDGGDFKQKVITMELQTKFN
jgi:hypothetical protein